MAGSCEATISTPAAEVNPSKTGRERRYDIHPPPKKPIAIRTIPIDKANNAAKSANSFDPAWAKGATVLNVRRAAKAVGPVCKIGEEVKNDAAIGATIAEIQPYSGGRPARSA